MPKTKEKIYVGSKEAKEALKADDKELTKWRKTGMPHKVKSTKEKNLYFYCLEDCHKWFSGQYETGK